MKTKQLVFFMVLAAFSMGVKAQTTKAKKDSVTQKQDNFLDLASKSLTGMFGESLEGNPNGIKEGIGFLELLEKTQFSEKEKEEYRKVYIGQSQGMTNKQKDSLDGVFFQKILEKEQIKTHEKP